MAANPLKDYTMPYRKGQLVFADGDLGTEMYIVGAGRVEIFKERGGSEVVLAVLEKGDFFGEMSLLEGLPRSASARCMEDSEIIEINGMTFDKMIKSNIEVAVRMLRKLSIRLRDVSSKYEGLLEEMEKGKHAPAAAPGKTAAPVKPRPTVTGEFAEPAAVTPAAAPSADVRVIGKLTVPDTQRTHNLTTDQVMVGRHDPVTGITPEVDLTADDRNRSVSRRHAKIIHSKGKFFVSEEVGTLNGTFVNGKRIPTGVLTPIADGDSVNFGLVQTVFNTGA